MKTLRWAIILVAVGQSGCGGDPENDVLPVGSEAIVSAERSVSLEDPSRSDLSYPSLSPGVRVTVGFDPGHFYETEKDVEERAKSLDLKYPEKAAEIRKVGPRKFEKGTSMAKFRYVKVTVESGELQGVSGSVDRRHLRLKK